MLRFLVLLFNTKFDSSPNIKFLLIYLIDYKAIINIIKLNLLHINFIV